MDLNKRIPLSSVQVIVKHIPATSSHLEMLMVSSMDRQTRRALQVVVRRMHELEGLSRHIQLIYGGYIIPTLDIGRVIKLNTKKSTSQEIETYLNDCMRNAHAKHDQILYSFLFHSEMTFPRPQTYQKYLTDAAVLSRRYLNTIFTRKQHNIVSNPKVLKFMECWQGFNLMAANYKEIRNIVECMQGGYDLVEDIVGSLCQAIGGMGKAILPIQLLDASISKQLKRYSRLIAQAEQAHMRWQVLSQTVRQLQCNIYKGMHEDMMRFKEKERQLIEWTDSIGEQLMELQKLGYSLMEKISIHIIDRKIQESSFNDCLISPKPEESPPKQEASRKEQKQEQTTASTEMHKQQKVEQNELNQQQHDDV